MMMAGKRSELCLLVENLLLVRTVHIYLWGQAINGTLFWKKHYSNFFFLDGWLVIFVDICPLERIRSAYDPSPECN